jgi:hypothetical protein
VEYVLSRTGDGAFDTTVSLPAGKHHFYYVVDHKKTHLQGFPHFRDNISGTIFNIVTVFEQSGLFCSSTFLNSQEQPKQQSLTREKSSASLNHSQSGLQIF